MQSKNRNTDNKNDCRGCENKTHTLLSGLSNLPTRTKQPAQLWKHPYSRQRTAMPQSTIDFRRIAPNLSTDTLATTTLKSVLFNRLAAQGGVWRGRSLHPFIFLPPSCHPLSRQKQVCRPPLHTVVRHSSLTFQHMMPQLNKKVKWWQEGKGGKLTGKGCAQGNEKISNAVNIVLHWTRLTGTQKTTGGAGEEFKQKKSTILGRWEGLFGCLRVANVAKK